MASRRYMTRIWSDLVKRTVCLLMFSLLLPTLLAACSPTYKCDKARDYMYAEEFPPLKSPPGLEVPAPDPSMRIRDVAGGPVHYYRKPSEEPGEYNFSDCLVSPPSPAS